ncbi:snRNA-activating protein complex subunit 1-like [Mercenaria mercenaria]|uniref:snRNA-activating protein complex subunit 1-like n=1 Tax=Mercenaria mercenaria TaxID=6596 RepID=UPI00234F5713|nr:snRNA-activating protein complex subunit 1-like [Mercenaria mercenaria]
MKTIYYKSNGKKGLKLHCEDAKHQKNTQVVKTGNEVVEQCFHIATQFWLPPSSFLVRAGALYLLYGLYHYQLVLPKVKVSLKQRGSDDNKIIPDSMKEETSMLDEIFSSSSLNQLSLVHDQYQKMKLAIHGEDAAEPDTSLNIVHSDLITGIYKTLQTHRVRQAGLKNKEKNIESTEDEEEILTAESQSVKKKLKQKAFEQSTGGYRELPGRGEKRKSEGRQDIRY